MQEVGGELRNKGGAEEGGEGEEEGGGVRGRQLELLTALVRDVSGPCKELLAKLNCKSKRVFPNRWRWRWAEVVMYLVVTCHWSRLELNSLAILCSLCPFAVSGEEVYSLAVAVFQVVKKGMNA